MKDFIIVKINKCLSACVMWEIKNKKENKQITKLFLLFKQKYIKTIKVEENHKKRKITQNLLQFLFPQHSKNLI